MPTGALVEVENRENEPSVEVGGREGRRGSLARRRAVACDGVVGRPLPMDPTPFNAPFTLFARAKPGFSLFDSAPQIDGEGGGGLELNPVLLPWLGIMRSSVGEGITSLKKKPLVEPEKGLARE